MQEKERQQQQQVDTMNSLSLKQTSIENLDVRKRSVKKQAKTPQVRVSKEESKEKEESKDKEQTTNQEQENDHDHLREHLRDHLQSSKPKININSIQELPTPTPYLQFPQNQSRPQSSRP